MEELILLRNPYNYFLKYNNPKNINYKDLFIKFSIQFFIVLLLIILAKLFLPKSDGLLNTSNKTTYLILVIFPLVEELMFRYFLHPYKSNFLIILVSIIYGVLLKFKLFDLISVYSLIYIGLIFFFFYKEIDFLCKEYITNFFIKRYNLLFYSSAVFFSIMHINNGLNGLNNFKIDVGLFLGYFFMLTSYFVFAIFVSNIRIKYGFKYSVLFHVLNNTIPLIVFLLGSVFIKH